MSRGSKYLPMIQTVFRAEGLPLDLAYIPVIESGFKPNALSKASAKGPLAVYAADRRDHGLKTDWYIDERSDPEKATVAAAKYLKSLHKMFDGDWHLVLAAYNGGLGRLQRAIRSARTEDFWSLANSSRYLPRETREYVPLILAAIIVAKNPVAVRPHLRARRSDCLREGRGSWSRGFATGGRMDGHHHRRNPGTQSRAPPVDNACQVSTVRSEGSGRHRRQASSACWPIHRRLSSVSLNWYSVKRGETLATVARKHGVKRSDLAEANNLKVNAAVRSGQNLIIPREPASLIASRTERPAPVTVTSRSIAVPASVEATNRPSPSRPVTYRVKRGDTLSSIAQLFDTTVAKLRSLNRLDSNDISVGDRLTVQRPLTRFSIFRLRLSPRVSDPPLPASVRRILTRVLRALGQRDSQRQVVTFCRHRAAD